jgi:hypothetical protein
MQSRPKSSDPSQKAKPAWAGGLPYDFRVPLVICRLHIEWYTCNLIAALVPRYDD